MERDVGRTSLIPNPGRPGRSRRRLRWVTLVGLGIAILILFPGVVPATKSPWLPHSVRITPGVAPEIAPVRVKLIASPSFLNLGNTTNLTAVVSAGVPWFNFSWPILPTGCIGHNRSSVNCTPAQAGRFTVMVTVTDSTGRMVSNSTTIEVNATSSSTSTGSALNPPTVYLFAGILGVAAAVVSTLLVVFALRRRSRLPPPPREPDRLYIPPKTE